MKPTRGPDRPLLRPPLAARAHSASPSARGGPAGRPRCGAARPTPLPVSLSHLGRGLAAAAKVAAAAAAWPARPAASGLQPAAAVAGACHQGFARNRVEVPPHLWRPAPQAPFNQIECICQQEEACLQGCRAISAGR